ncbi:MAG TPA: AI-2E family transporter [Vicinamibacteria bacterium]|nr:AI-2E family transporter [Vicinamibacteria bacterium]
MEVEQGARRAERWARERRALVLSLLPGLLVVLALAFQVFRHFLITFTVAASAALLMAPLQRRLARALRGGSSVAAGLIVLLTALLILVPVVGSAALLREQAVAFFEWALPRLQPAALEQLWRQTLPARFPWLEQWVDFEQETLPQFVSHGLSQAVSTLNRLIQLAVAGLTTAFLELMLFLVILFFLLRDGGLLRAQLRRISPLSEAREAQVAQHLERTVKGVLQAMVLVPVAQGLVALLGFAVFGLPSPLLWTVMVVLVALVPLVGTPLVWLPACGYLFAQGATWQSVGLLLYGVFAISSVDNVIKPMLLRGAARIHPLLGFLAILGGLLSFGPLGFLIGPVILSLVLSALRVYELDVLGRDEGPAAEASAPVA